MWISWIPKGSGAPGLMTGSAGTAMDVLETCFSKKGGGSGRRVGKNRAPLVISVRDTDPSEFFSRKGLRPRVLFLFVRALALYRG